MWVKDLSVHYVNLAHVTFLEALPGGGGWQIRAHSVDGTDYILSGLWGSQSAVSEAIRELVTGVDPATYGD